MTPETKHRIPEAIQMLWKNYIISRDEQSRLFEVFNKLIGEKPAVDDSVDALFANVLKTFDTHSALTLEIDKLQAQKKATSLELADVITEFVEHHDIEDPSYFQTRDGRILVFEYDNAEESWAVRQIVIHKG